MKNLYRAITAEILKLRRSVIFTATLVFFLFIPLILGLFIVLSQHPELLSKLGIIGTKAQLFESNDWKGYLSTLNQMNAILSFIGFGFVLSWIFGREHMEHTITSLIALPIQRKTIVFSKLIIGFLWCAILALIMFAAGIAVGFIFKIPEWSPMTFQSFAKTFWIVALLTYLITTPFAFIASWSRGIVAALASIIVTLILTQFIVIVGLGHLFPWAVPGILSVLDNQPELFVNEVSYVSILVTSFAGILATVLWWLKADHQ